MTPAIVERTVARRGVSSLLSPHELETFAQLVVEKRRRDWLAGRVAAKRAVRRALKVVGERVPLYAAIDIQNDGDGAPVFVLRGRPRLSERFNLSIAHSDGAAAAAIAETATIGRVGVDLEVTKPLDLALVRRVLSSSELERLDDSAPHPSPLFMWTAKEAAMKAAHHACDALRDVELSWQPSGVLRARVIGRGASPSIRVRHRVVGPYTVAVALCR